METSIGYISSREDVHVTMYYSLLKRHVPAQKMGCLGRRGGRKGGRRIFVIHPALSFIHSSTFIYISLMMLMLAYRF